MMRLPLLALMGFALTPLLSCGAGDEGTGPTILTSHHALCAGATPEYAGGYATMTGCAFLQHADNIARFGEGLSGEMVIYDSSGTKLANVTHSCDNWTIGTDAKGVTVLVDRDTGNVVSHGALHAGQPTTEIASPAPLPLEVR